MPHVTKKGKSMMDFINTMIAAENSPLTKGKFKEIRNNGSEEELIEAVEEMLKLGGYANLAD